MTTKYDVVDVTVTSTNPIVDAILEAPLLSGEKKYSVEVTEFTAPLSNEPPLPLISTFQKAPVDTMLLFRVRRKRIGQGAIHTNTLLSQIAASFNDNLRGLFEGIENFTHSVYTPIRTPNDMVFYLQEYFDEIKKIYAQSTDGLLGDQHGDDDNDVSAANMALDSFVRVLLTPNGTVRFYFSAIFCKHFFIETSHYCAKLFGLEESDNRIIAFRAAAGGVVTGLSALYGNGVVIIEGATGETVVLQCKYPLTRHFDHRIRLEIDSGGMPVPAVVDWGTDNKQRVRHTISSHPINQRFETAIGLNTQGANTGSISFATNMFLGDVVWRRAEDKVSERYELTNSQFFQNIRLEVFIIRREWNTITNEFAFKRRAMTLADGESWTCKLRFRTF